MKLKVLTLFAGAALVFCGCVDTVAGRKTPGVPFMKDQVEGHYERTVNQVYDAAKEVVTYNGTLVSESTLHTSTNEVKTVEGKINQRDIYIRVEAIDPKVTAIKVQTRTQGGVTDIDLAHEIEKQVAIKLVSAR